MNWNAFVQQFHRWLSIAFTVTVIANFAFVALGGAPLWVTYSPPVPLLLLLFTGLYMFMLSIPSNGMMGAAPAHWNEHNGPASVTSPQYRI